MKKILSALFILTLLLSCVVACDSMPILRNTTETALDFASPDTEIESTDDISNYEGVIALFKDIVNLYPSYTEEKMLLNECDGVDLISDEETKELYKKLFISGYRFYLEDYAYKYQADGRNYFGYAMTDLNKNGSEELILLTDMYDIVAVFSMIENQPKLLLDNYEKKYDCRIDEQGKFYTQYYSADNLYTQIYLLNEFDNLVLDEKYMCVRYNYYDCEECYDITSGEEIRISKAQWTNLTHGWVYGYDAGIITKAHADLNFIRLFGELHLYMPDICSWDWSSRQFATDENAMFISMISSGTVSISLYDCYYIYQCKVSVKAMLNGNIATFETEEISGRLEFGLGSVWLIIEESDVWGVPCGAYLYTELSYSKG